MIHLQDVKQPEDPWRPGDGELFLKGPIAWVWLVQAGRLAGSALHVALAIRLLTGMTKNPKVRVGPKYLREIGVSRNAGYRAIDKLEQSGLITVKRSRGRAPEITVVEVSGQAAGQGDGQEGQPAKGSRRG